MALPITLTLLLAITPLLIHARGPATITRQFFTFTDFRNARKADLAVGAPPKATIIKATSKEFPGLDGQSVSAAMLLFPPSGINAPHTHPGSAELLMVISGTLEVGLVDSNNTLFKQTLQASDHMFVFPKGLVHYQVNVDVRRPATAVGMFGSAVAGTVAIGKSVFGSGIDEGVLAKLFKTDVRTIDMIVKRFKLRRIS